MADIFRALDDETRRLILDELAGRDGQTLFELCSVLTMRHNRSISRQGISQHIAVLEEAGLVRTERSGRTKLHYFTPEPLAQIAQRWPLGLGPPQQGSPTKQGSLIEQHTPTPEDRT